MTTRLAQVKRVLTMDADEALEPLMLRLVLLLRRYPLRMHAVGFLVTGVNAAAIWVFAGPRFVAWSFGLLWLWTLVVIVAWCIRERLGRTP
jgi:hypothetical protein